MGEEAHRSDSDGIEELRKLLPGRHSIRPYGDGYEIVISDAMDEALTFFVSFPKAKLQAPKSAAPPTAPGEPGAP
ncbi:MAG TPA: hypothetical protein VJ927_04280 [Actinomycetota bacterium]|nr:hypothetical protein [Actinomycetota bacterium]